MTSAGLAVVTGASSGIGAELALLFAADGFDLLLTAEDGPGGEGLEPVAVRCRTAGVEVQTFPVDLRTADGVQALYETAIATGQPVAAAAVNAGVGRGGAFVDADPADLLEVVQLNVASTVHLTRLLLADMVARDAGRLLLTSSIASTMPGSFQAVYNASKSFVQSLAEALQDELRDTGVTVTSLMPGPTDTNFFHRAEMDDTRIGQGPKDDPADVAQQGYAALMAGKDRVVAASAMTKAQELAAKVLPDKAKAALHRVMAEPQDDEEAGR
ncbi:Short-chain dehydrogenase [Friedmanniella luteola]|uniref:Short-chain dehydrogenase n=1 Tax=Friedmanniella luteola TaxID=546871 RepID=A0A1H1NBE0_9ACTN|nr:SDR family NAD(P)-dependent oxidoreductase [Friedmanniella luteola]SDR96075.1 Short-chain dehydrogenase [Friedmanniella luteola]